MAAGTTIRFRELLRVSYLGGRRTPRAWVAGRWTQRKNPQGELLCSKQLGLGNTEQTGCGGGEHLVGQYRRDLKIFKDVERVVFSRIIFLFL